MKTDDVQRELYPRPVSGALVSRLPSALVPARQSHKGQYVELAPLDAASHAGDLFAASHGSEKALRIWDYLADGPWPDVESYASALRQQSSTLDRIYFAVRPHGETAFCGQASFLDIHAQNGVIEIGHIWFGLQLQRTRAATEALYLMLNHAMGDLGYRRMQWRCNAQNRNSMAAAERLGFRFEGIFYNHLIIKGKNRDTAWFSILDDEWPELSAIFERWLAPANFDIKGNALTSLSAMTGARNPTARTI
ncbi:MAG: GNAT family N-acetyltransferase [Alphaproteobacteria bacterium]|nr:GNAT family N-acetyltransferase [Alphaproteobacteria bacterium]